MYVLLAVLGLLLPESATAKVRSAAEAASVAARTSGTRRAPGAAPQLMHTRMAGSRPALYVFNHGDNGGYTIVSGDDRMPDILGYADSGSVNPDSMPPAMNWWLEQYAAEAAQFYRLADSVPNHPALAPVRRVPLGNQEVQPLVTARWGQSNPYNNRCPLKDGSRSVTGCVATAMAMVIDYHRPEINRSAGRVVSTYDGTEFNFGSEQFNWDLMLDSYSGNYTSEQANAVATLMLACGASVNMQYSPEESGAYPTFYTPHALTEYFGLDKNIRLTERKHCEAYQWDVMLYNEMAAARPVIYSGSGNGGGHCFVCDGYRWHDGNYFHFNWGWDGMADGWFLTSMLSPGSLGTGGGTGGGYSSNQSIITHIQRPVEGSAYDRALSVYNEENNGFFAENSYYYNKVTLGVQILSRYPRALGCRLGIMVKGTEDMTGEEVEEFITTTQKYTLSACNGNYYGYLGTYYTVPLDQLAPGSYYAYPAIQLDGEGWKVIPQDLHNVAAVELLIGDDRYVYCFNKTEPANPNLSVQFNAENAVKGIKRPGFSVEVQYSATNHSPVDFNSTLTLVAFRQGANTANPAQGAFSTSQKVLISYTDGIPKIMGMPLDLPVDIAPGHYKLRFFVNKSPDDTDSGYIAVSDAVGIDIEPALVSDGKISVLECPNEYYQNKPASAVLFNGTNVEFNGYVYAVFWRDVAGLYRYVDQVSLKPGCGRTVEFVVEPNKFISAGHYDVKWVYYVSDAATSISGYKDVKFYGLDGDTGLYYCLSDDNSQAEIRLAENPTCVDGGHFTLPTTFTCTVPDHWDDAAKDVAYKTVTVPVTELASDAFATQHSVTDLHIPAGYSAAANFEKARGIENYWFGDDEPYFSATPLPHGLQNAAVYVPAGSYPSYLTKLHETGVLPQGEERYNVFEAAADYYIMDLNAIPTVGNTYVTHIVTDIDGGVRFDPRIEVSSSDPSVATVEVNPFHTLEGNRVELVIKAHSQGVTMLRVNPRQYGARGSEIRFAVTGNASVDEIDAADTEAEYFDLSGRRIHNPTPGLYLRRVGGKVGKAVRLF